MRTTVIAATTQKYRNGLTVIPGGKSDMRGRRRGRRTRTAAELYLDNQLHTDFVQMGPVPVSAFEDVRRHRQHPWRFLARRIIEAHAAGVSRDKVRAVALSLLKWIDALYDTSNETVQEQVYYQSPRVA